MIFPADSGKPADWDFGLGFLLKNNLLASLNLLETSLRDSA
jgi:hypothetical protein